MNPKTWQQWTVLAARTAVYLALILGVSFVSYIISVLGLYALGLVRNWDIDKDIHLVLATIPMALTMVGFITVAEFCRRAADPKIRPWPMHMIEKAWIRRTVQLVGLVVCPVMSLGVLFASWAVWIAGLYTWSMIREWELEDDLCVFLALFPAALTMAGFITVCEFSWKAAGRKLGARTVASKVDHEQPPS